MAVAILLPINGMEELKMLEMIERSTEDMKAGRFQTVEEILEELTEQLSKLKTN